MRASPEHAVLSYKIDFADGRRQGASFLELELPFPALLNLHIDVHKGLSEQDALAPSGYAYELRLQSFVGTDLAPGAPRIRSPCAALQAITLFAVDEPIARANSRHVAFLAHTLGQHQRPKTQRVKLALVGVDFARPVARTLLRETVSVIHRYWFAGLDSPEDYDGVVGMRALRAGVT